MATLSPPSPPTSGIRTSERRAEVSWFAALCGDDYEFLGVPDDRLRSSYEHCGEIVRQADAAGYQNILLPTSWIPGQEPIAFAAAMSPQTEQINFLVALRMGEAWPPMLARAIATLDHIAKGRLTLNIISSNLPGQNLESADRYARSREVIRILKLLWESEGPVEWDGPIFPFKLPNADPARPYQQNGGPLLYFGGISPPAQALCAEFCDVFLMWPETEQRLAQTMSDLSAQAAAFGRSIDFGLRAHVIVRETEAEARAAADRLLSRLDPAKGKEIKRRSLDSQSAGVRRQDELRAAADDYYIEDRLWSGIGLARSGCSSAIIGDPDQVLGKLQRYLDMGIRSFILSGYPHIDECELFSRYVLPRLPQFRLNQRHRRQVPNPVTPLTTAPRR